VARPKAPSVLLCYNDVDILPEKKQRAFIEAAPWSYPQWFPPGRTPFTRIGKAGTLFVPGRTVVAWSKDAANKQ